MIEFRYNRLINKELVFWKIFTILDIFKVLGGMIASFAIFQSGWPFVLFMVCYIWHALKFRLNKPPGAFKHWLDFVFRSRVMRPGHSACPHPIRIDEKQMEGSES